MEDSDSFFYEEDFDDAGLLSAVHEAEAAKRQRLDPGSANLVHVQLPPVRTGWPQQSGVPGHPLITELPRTPASGRSHIPAAMAGGSGREPLEERAGPSGQSAAFGPYPESSSSLVPVSGPPQSHSFAVGQRGGTSHSQNYAQNSRPPDQLRTDQQQSASHSVPDAHPASILVLPNATPPLVSPQPNNPYYVTHPMPPTGASHPTNQQPLPGHQRIPLRPLPENPQVPPSGGTLALINRNELRPQSAPLSGQENPPAAPPVVKKEKDLWLNCPRASVFRSFQDEAMQILDSCDYQIMQGKKMIKKTGWRKLGMFFGVNYEIKDFRDDTDQNGDIVRSKFCVKAIMPNGRYCEATGSCDANEKRFSKPNNDIPATAETRAKTRAVQDLLGIGEWKNHS